MGRSCGGSCLNIDPLLRMRSMWIVVYPLIALIAILIIAPVQPFFVLPIFSPLFPVGVLIGSGLTIRDHHQADWLLAFSFTLVFFYVYIAFIVKIKEFSKTSLRSISLALMVAYVLGIKGCAFMASNFRF